MWLVVQLTLTNDDDIDVFLGTRKHLIRFFGILTDFYTDIYI